MCNHNNNNDSNNNNNNDIYNNNYYNNNVENIVSVNRKILLHQSLFPLS